MIMPGKITLKQIAESCGVTVQTASRILNSNLSSLYHRDTVRKVKETAERLGYRPNGFAQSIRSGRFKSISLLLSPYIAYSSFSGEYFFAIEEVLRGADYKLMINFLPLGKENDDVRLPGVFREKLVDGAIIGITHAIPEWLGKHITNMHVPLVWIGSKHRFDCVHHDDFAAAAEATLKLISAGHRKISYVDMSIAFDDPGPVHFSVRDRENGYVHSMKSAGLKPSVIRPEKKLSAGSIAKFADEKIFVRERPSAVLCYDFAISGRNILYSLCRRNMLLPEDLTIVSFNDEAVTEGGFKIPTILPCKSEIAEAAAKMLLEKINSGVKHKEPVILKFKFENFGGIR